MAKKFKTKTVKTRDNLKRASTAIKVSKFILPFVPSGVLVGINWEDWIEETGGSLPAGLIMAIFSAIIVSFGVTKKEQFEEKKISPIFVLTIGVAIAGVACLLLANILEELGITLLVSAIGAAASSVGDQINMSVITPKLQEYNDIIKEVGLDEKTNKKEERREQAKAELEEARRRATE